MAITGVNNYTGNINYYAQQALGKKFSSVRDYGTYLTEKYDCLKSSDYSVTVNSSLLSKALGDEKTAAWLEYNLALIPECVEKMKAVVEARGSKLVSCSITINGYDSMTSVVCTRSEADPGTEKARKQLEERLEKRKEEKKAKEKKVAKKRAEKAQEEKRIAETETKVSSFSVTGNSVQSVTQSLISAMFISPGEGVAGFDVKA